MSARIACALLCLGPSLALLCACKEEEASYRWLPQVAVSGRQVALIDGHSEQLRGFGLTPQADDSLPSWTVELPEAPYALWERAGDGRDLIVAAGGERGGEQAPVLALIAAGGALRQYPLAARYEALAQSEDGAFAVAHFPPDARGQSAARGQVAVIALDRKRDAHEVALEHEGEPWSQLWLSPALALEGGALHVAAASFQRTLGVLVLEHAEAGPLFVALTAQRARPARPRQLLAIREQGRLAWLGEGLDDVFVASLRRVDAAHGVELEVAQHAAGSGPTALALGADAAGAPVLLVVSDGGRTLRVLDPERGELQRFELDQPASAIAACTPGCAHALLYTAGGAEATMVDVARAAAGDESALTALQLSGALAGVSVVQHGARSGPYALGRHAAGGVSWFDLEAGVSHGVELGAAQTQSAQIGEDGGLWIAPASGALVTRIDPESSARFEVELEAPIARLVLVPAAGAAVAIHAGLPLAFSVLPDPPRDPADVVYVEDLP